MILSFVYKGDLTEINLDLCIHCTVDLKNKKFRFTSPVQGGGGSLDLSPFDNLELLSNIVQGARLLDMRFISLDADKNDLIGEWGRIMDALHKINY